MDVDEQTGLFRSLMDGRRMLLVLDNASNAEQVRALVPGAPRCFVLVTSRSQLSGLVATEHAYPLVLDLLTHAEARQLLSRRLGTHRLRAEEAAGRAIIDMCARLPLALAIVAARAAARRDFGLAALADELHAAGGRLDAFAGLDAVTEVRSVFSWSYRALSAPAAALFRALGLHPGPDFATAAVASLAGLPIEQARMLLAELSDAHLVTEHLPGRYTFHDLLRAYAAELGLAHDSPTARRQAQHRMYDHYLLTAHGGSSYLTSWDSIAPSPPQPSAIVEDLHDYRKALAWFSAEHQVLLAVIKQAADVGFIPYVGQLALTLTEYLYRQGHWHEWTGVLQHSLDIAVEYGDCREQARCHRELARVYARLGCLEAATTHVKLALELCNRLHDRLGSAFTHRIYGVLLEVQGRQADALMHDLHALRLFETIGHRTGLARAMNSVGWSHARLGNYELTLRYCRRALPLLAELGDRQAEAATWDSLGYAHHHRGEHRQAVTCYCRAVELFEDLGDRYKQSECLTHLGDLHILAGQPDAACTAWRSAMDILSALGHLDIGPLRARLHGFDAAVQA
jgi:tetratricopeptide (TPR) repeat protein